VAPPAAGGHLDLLLPGEPEDLLREERDRELLRLRELDVLRAIVGLAPGRADEVPRLADDLG
jgi:hypothetical protein